MKSCSCLGKLSYYIKCTSFSESLPVSGKEESEEKSTKRNPGGWRCMPFIIGNEMFEKVATMALMVNFTLYLMNHFNVKQVMAANVTNIFNGTANFAPLLGAFISDAYWGRYKTLAYACIFTFLGMVTLTLTTIIPVLRPPSCSPADQLAGNCEGPTKLQVCVLVFSMLLLAIGAGGIRPTCVPFGVDQFDRKSEQGQRELASFFNWYHATSTAGTMIALTVIVYLQSSISWTIGLSIPTALMFVSVVFFLSGTRLYVFVPPEGSVFSGIVQVFVAAYRKRSLQLPAPDVDVLRQEEILFNPPTRSERILKLPLTLQYRCLNKSAIIREGELNQDGSIANPWRLCTVQQVEEVKCLLRIAPIWCSGIICLIALAQQWTFSVLQSLRMDRHVGKHIEFPASAIGAFSLFALVLFVPIYDRLLVPVLRRITGIDRGITLLQRQGVGMVLAIITMAISGRVEKLRRNSCWAHGGPNGMSPMSAFWLAPQLTIMGIAESFNAVGQIEFYNRQFPEHMQTIAASLFYCTIAGASYMSGLLVLILQKNTNWLVDNINLGRVEYYFYLIAFLGLINFLYFLLVSHYYRYKGAPQVEMALEKLEGELDVL